ncbi:MAG: helix-turn-helix domain-containing protein [Bryobacteraceae bacterium]
MKQNLEELVDHILSGGFFLEEAVEILEKTLIAGALTRTAGNQSAASKLLGIHRNTLQRKMIEYNLDGRAPRRTPRRKPVTRAVAKKTRKKKAS